MKKSNLIPKKVACIEDLHIVLNPCSVDEKVFTVREAADLLGKTELKRRINDALEASYYGRKATYWDGFCIYFESYPACYCWNRSKQAYEILGGKGWTGGDRTAEFESSDKYSWNSDYEVWEKIA